MTNLQLLQAIGYAQDAHILDAEELPVKEKVIPLKKPAKPVIRAVAAVLAAVLAISLFLQTPMGAAAAEVVREQVERFLDLLFPPKEMVMYIEGEPETVHVEAQGREPEADRPGFSIYVDTQVYTMTEENGVWFIRPIHNTAGLPPVEMEIREIPDMSPVDAAQKVHTDMAGKWEHLSDIWSYGQPITLCINASQDAGGTSLWERHDFKGNGKEGCYQIISRGYREAAEGHGTRFMQMLGTFSLVAPQDTSQYSDKDDALLDAIRQEIAFAQEQDAKLLESGSNGQNQAEMNTAAYEREALWLGIHSKLWTALEQTLTEEAFYDLWIEELEWTGQKRQELADILEEMGGGSLSGAAVSGYSANKIRERTMILLTYLEGTAAPAARTPGLEISPEPAVTAFAKAYFAGDIPAMEGYLSESYSEAPESFAAGSEVIHAVKGLENVHKDMMNNGWLNASVEYRPTADSDSYSYLSITLVWERGRWAVEAYGLEG